jgi:hypothetical protein
MQPSLFDGPPVRDSSRFDGQTFDRARDADRLGCQLASVRAWMLAHQWQTLAEIARGVGYSDAAVASVSARLRDLRKRRFGGYAVERRRRTTGTWEYRVTRPEESAA